MALNDCVPWNLLERLISNDLNTNSDLIQRMLSEVTRSFSRTISVDDHSTEPTVLVRTHVASGLTVGPNGAFTSTIVHPGILIQQVPSNPPDVPVPGLFDSTFRVGLLLADEDVGDPWDGVAGFWLLQARVVRTTTLTEVRDIFNPATQTFAPGAPIPKRYESQIEFDWKKGNATDLPLPDAGWAPIASINSTAAGITNPQIINLAVQLEELSPMSADTGRAVRHRFEFRSRNGFGQVGIAGGDCYFDLEAEVAGAKCSARTVAGTQVVIADANYVEAASAAALAVQDTWGYIYLAPLPDAMPKEAPGTFGAPRVHGVLVISRTPPDEHGQNTVAITPPAPFTNYVVPIGGAAHVGLLRVGAGGFPRIAPIAVSASGRGRIDFRQFNNSNFQMTQANGFDGPAGPAYALAGLGPGGTEDVPFGVAIEGCLQHQAVPAVAPVAAALEVTFGMGTGATADAVASPQFWERCILPTMTLSTRRFWLYPHNSADDPNLTMTLAFIPRTIAMANSGGGAGDGVGVVMEAGMIGFQF